MSQNALPTVAFLTRREQSTRGAGETWRPVPCTELTPVRRFFDLQAGTVFSDLARILPTLTGTIIDVGCGAQPYRPLISKHATYIGIDTAEAKTAFGYETPDTLYYDGFTWPLGSQCADAVLATETLEHVPEPEQFIGEAARVLRENGLLILTVPFAARWHFIPFDYWRFTPAGLRKVLSRGGFTNIEVYARGNALTVASYKLLAVLTTFVLPQVASKARSILYRVIGLLLLPLFILTAIVGNISLRSGSGDDCLGYTCIARKESPNV
jgi:SAM-dependent methyltransferase